MTYDFAKQHLVVSQTNKHRWLRQQKMTRDS